MGSAGNLVSVAIATTDPNSVAVTLELSDDA
jgi:hypothetical protein